MRKYLHIACEILELGAAILVLIGILISGAGLIFNEHLFKEMFLNIGHFREYLEHILTLVIGMEFLQMLCKPNSDNVLETLIFLVARHMIVGETDPYQDFVSVISVALLCIVKRYLHNSREDREKREHGEEVLEKQKSENGLKGIIIDIKEKL